MQSIVTIGGIGGNTYRSSLCLFVWSEHLGVVRTITGCGPLPGARFKVLVSDGSQQSIQYCVLILGTSLVTFSVQSLVDRSHLHLGEHVSALS